MKEHHETCYDFSLWDFTGALQSILSLSKKKRICKLTKIFFFFQAKAFLKVQVSLEKIQLYLLFNKTIGFEYHSKYKHVQAEVKNHNEDTAVLFFSVMFLLSLGRIKPQESLCLLLVCLSTS